MIELAIEEWGSESSEASPAVLSEVPLCDCNNNEEDEDNTIQSKTIIKSQPKNIVISVRTIKIKLKQHQGIK